MKEFGVVGVIEIIKILVDIRLGILSVEIKLNVLIIYIFLRHIKLGIIM